VPALEPIDLRFGGHEHVIGVYLLETDDGPALFDCGPASCVERLKEGLGERGLELRDVRHLLLSHIHLDHAGAAGVLVREHPELRVHVSEVGAPHLVDPARLEASARRLYGDAFDSMWGELAPVPKRNVEVAEGAVIGLECFPSPGHARHHICYADREGTLYAGDAAGVRIQPGRLVVPPTPPPELDLEAWERTLDEIERRRPDRLALVHYGVACDPQEHLSSLRRRLREWAAIVERGASEEDFVSQARAEIGALDAERLPVYETAMPFWQSYAGLKRYWEKRREAA
jgi:glyoxylase-like metal-dependent hydrolase (beta-lactamase superfamily II)